MAFCTKNTLFVRNLSPQVSEAILRDTFGQCDVVERVLFRSFPGRATEYFAQIDFRTSAGVTEGFKLSGTPIMGVTCEVSVMDPGSKAMMKQVWEARDQQLLPPEEPPHPSEPQGVQAEYMRRFGEKLEDKRLRTVHVAGLPEDASEEGLKQLCRSLGELEEIRLDADEEGKKFALLEFTDRAVAYEVKRRQQFLVDGKVLTFSESKTLVDTRAFAEQSVHFSTPIFDAATMKAVLAYQCHLNPKLAKARAAAAEIMNEPVPPETEAILKKAEEEKEKEEALVEWPGRSERDSTQHPWRPERKRSASRRRSRSRRRGDRRRRRSRSCRSGRRGRRRRREEDRRQDDERREKEKADGAIDLDDDVAVVPNTEMLVLGESSSYSSGEEKEKEEKEKAEEPVQPPEPPPPPEPECHEVLDLPSPVRSIADSPAEELEEAPLPEEEDVPMEEPPPREEPDVHLGTPWECPSCGEMNKGSREKCNNCGRDAPWIKREEPVEEVDELSTPSPASPSPASPAKSIAESPPSPARSVAASGSARSVQDSPVRSPASIEASPGHLVDLEDEAAVEEAKVDPECEWAAELKRGELADARARIFHES